MSYWTHIAGCIRIDMLPLGQSVIMDFGNTVDFNDDNEVWDRCNVPCGSEGSLSYKLILNEEESCIAHSQLVVWGDLRDFYEEDYQSIEDWLVRVVKEVEKYGSIRQGILEANEVVYQYVNGIFKRINNESKN